MPVRAPEVVRLPRMRERGALGAVAPALAACHQAVAIEHGVDGADGGALHIRTACAQARPDLGRPQLGYSRFRRRIVFSSAIGS